MQAGPPTAVVLANALIKGVLLSLKTAKTAVDHSSLKPLATASILDLLEDARQKLDMVATTVEEVEKKKEQFAAKAVRLSSALDNARAETKKLQDNIVTLKTTPMTLGPSKRDYEKLERELQLLQDKQAMASVAGTKGKHGALSFSSSTISLNELPKGSVKETHRLPDLKERITVPATIDHIGQFCAYADLYNLQAARQQCSKMKKSLLPSTLASQS
jgi:hypothetical protein